MPQSAVIFFLFQVQLVELWGLETGSDSDAARSVLPNSLPASSTVSATTLPIASRYACGMRMMTSNPE